MPVYFSFFCSMLDQVMGLFPGCILIMMDMTCRRGLLICVDRASATSVKSPQLTMLNMRNINRSHKMVVPVAESQLHRRSGDTPIE